VQIRVGWDQNVWLVELGVADGGGELPQLVTEQGQGLQRMVTAEEAATQVLRCTRVVVLGGAGDVAGNAEMNLNRNSFHTDRSLF
jgi:hypothetical protein